MTHWIEECFVKIYLLINYLKKKRVMLEKEIKSFPPLCLLTLIRSHFHIQEDVSKRLQHQTDPSMDDFGGLAINSSKPLLLTKLNLSL